MKKLFALLVLVVAVAFGIHQTRRHNRLLKDIESGLNELKEFGK